METGKYSDAFGSLKAGYEHAPRERLVRSYLLDSEGHWNLAFEDEVFSANAFAAIQIVRENRDMEHGREWTKFEVKDLEES